MAVNLKGTYQATQVVLPDMVVAGWGRIVNLSALGAQSGAPNMALYTATKGGVIAMTRSLAIELGPKGITVNSVSPGFIDTPMARRAIDGNLFPVPYRADPRDLSDPPARPTRGNRSRLRLLRVRRGRLHHSPVAGRKRRLLPLRAEAMSMIADLDLYDLPIGEQSFANDPNPHMIAARQRHPWLAKTDFGFIITDYEACDDIMRMDARLKTPAAHIVQIMGGEGTNWARFQVEGLIARDGADHERMRLPSARRSCLARSKLMRTVSAKWFRPCSTNGCPKVASTSRRSHPAFRSPSCSALSACQLHASRK